MGLRAEERLQPKTPHTSDNEKNDKPGELFRTKRRKLTPG